MKPTDPAPPVLHDLLAHAGFVRGLAQALVDDPTEADDVVQETWLAALVRPPTRAASGWLGSVVRRRAARTHRDRTRQAERRARRGTPTPEAATADHVAHDEQIRLLTEALLALPDDQREAITLRYYEGLPPRTIADRLGVPVETVRSRVRRGLKRMRARLDRTQSGNRRAWVAALAPLVRTPGGSAPLLALAMGLVLALGGVGVLLWSRTPLGGGDGRGPAGSPRAASPSPAEAARLRGAGESTEDAPAPTNVPAAPRPKDRPGAPATALLFGTVRDASGRPIRDASVSYLPTRSELLTGVIATTATGTAATDAAGRFRIGVDTTREGTLLATAPGYARTHVAALPGARTDLVLDVGGSVAVHAVDEDGRPVPGARITCARWRLPHWPIVTDEGGHALVEHLPLVPMDFKAQTSRLVGKNTPPIVVQAKRTVTVEVVLKARKTLRGKVLRNQDESPVSGAHIWLTPSMVGSSVLGETESRPDGSFSLPLDLEDATLQVHVQAPGLAYQNPLLARPMRPGEPIEPHIPDLLVLRLFEADAPIRVRLDVLGGGGEPLAGAQVQYGGDDGVALDATTTDADGRCGFDVFDVGVRPTLAGYRARTADGRIGVCMLSGRYAGEVLTLRVADAGTLAGQVVDEGGHPVAGALVRLSVDGAVDYRPTAPEGYVHNAMRLLPHVFAAPVATDADGRFDVGPWAVGTYRLEVAYGREGFAAVDDVTVRSGEATSLEVTLRKGGFLRGRVEIPEAVVPWSVRVHVTPAGEKRTPTPLRGRVFHGGRFEVRGIPTSTCEVECEGWTKDRRRYAARRGHVEVGVEEPVLTLEPAD